MSRSPRGRTFVWPRAVLVAVLFLLTAMVGALGAPSAVAVGGFDNAVIADYAISHYPPGSTGGQCRAFVNNVVMGATGINVGTGHPDYFAGFENAGAQRIYNITDLRKGDIVQIGQTEADPALHTFIIIGNVSGSTFEVIDSNHNRDNRVSRYLRPNVSLSDSTRAYRLGTISTANGSLADIFAVVRNDIGSNRTAAHVINGSNWGQYLLNTATGLPASNQTWSYDWGDLNRDGVLDLWAFNRNPGGGNTVVHVLNGTNLNQWLQAGNIALPATDANWTFKVGDFNRDGVADIFGINRAPGYPHTVVHIINGANWGQWLQAGDIALPATDANWDYDVADFNRDGVPDIWGFNRAPGYPHTVVHIISGSNWGLWLQAGDIALPATDATWSFAAGDFNGDNVPDIFGINRAPGYPHTVVHVINGLNWGQWWQAGDITLPATDSDWDFAIGNR